MKALVAFASCHQSAQDIADEIAGELRTAGLDVDLKKVDEVPRISGYDAVVLGSAVYMGAWLPEAWNFVDRFCTRLDTIPVWLFSSGPLGLEDPKPEGDPARMGDLMQITLAEDHHIFGGKLDLKALSFGERLITRVVRPPEGDFRDWSSIRGWAHQIATSLGHSRRIREDTG